MKSDIDQRDCVARCAYSGELTDAAEEFLTGVFRGETRVEEGVATLVTAAMHVVSGIAWIQPTEPQLKAAGLIPEKKTKGESSEKPEEKRPKR